MTATLQITNATYTERLFIMFRPDARRITLVWADREKLSMSPLTILDWTLYLTGMAFERVPLGPLLRLKSII